MDFRIPIQKFLYEISPLRRHLPSFPRSTCSYKNSAEHDGGSRNCIGFLYEPDRISDKTLTACLLTHNYIGCCIPKHSSAWYPATSSERRDLTSINSYLAHTYTIDRLSATITHPRCYSHLKGDGLNPPSPFSFALTAHSLQHTKFIATMRVITSPAR